MQRQVVVKSTVGLHASLAAEIVKAASKYSVDVKIQYKDKKVEKLCIDLKKAKKDLPANVAEKLHALINLIESADNLKDIDELQIYHLHPLHGQREGQYALDVAGRKAGYRLVIIPLDADGNEWKEKDVSVVYKSTEVIIAWEVSNHYE